MSNSGTTFRESVQVVTSGSAGSKTLVFQVENDGLIVSIQRTSGSANVTGFIKTNLPDPMTDVVLETLNVTDSNLYQFSNITGSRVTIELTWDAATEIKITGKMASGGAIRAYWRQVLADNMITSQVTVSTTPTLLVNESNRKTVAIKNWQDISATTVLYVGSEGDTAVDWPLTSREGLSIAVDENAATYLTASSSTIDARIMQITGNND